MLPYSSPLCCLGGLWGLGPEMLFSMEVTVSPKRDSGKAWLVAEGVFGV